jgi:hypothetical protein
MATGAETTAMDVGTTVDAGTMATGAETTTMEAGMATVAMRTTMTICMATIEATPVSCLIKVGDVQCSALIFLYII